MDFHCLVVVHFSMFQSEMSDRCPCGIFILSRIVVHMCIVSFQVNLFITLKYPLIFLNSSEKYFFFRLFQTIFFLQLTTRNNMLVKYIILLADIYKKKKKHNDIYNISIINYWYRLIDKRPDEKNRNVHLETK